MRKNQLQGAVTRLAGLGEDEQSVYLDQLIRNEEGTLLNTDEVIAQTNETNASDWSLEEVELTHWELSARSGEFVVEFAFAFEGETDEDRGYLGRRVLGDASATIFDDGRIHFEVRSAEVDQADFEDDESDD